MKLHGWVRSNYVTLQNVEDNINNSDETTTVNDDNEEDTQTNSDDQSDEDTDTAFEEKTMYTNDTYVNIRSGPSTDSEIIMVVEINTSIKVIGEEGDWYKVSTSKGEAYISKELLSDERTSVTTSRGNLTKENNEAETKVSTSNSVNGQNIVKYAKKFLGVSYVYGGESPSGFDCSGFTMYVYNNFGISMSHSAKAQSTLGEEVSANKNSKTSLLNNLEVGDLVFFLDYETMDEIGHCGIYIGEGEFIHASSGSGYCVKIDSLLPGEYYNTRYYSARRVI